MVKRKWNKVNGSASTAVVRNGFTIIEVLLVLAISSALFIGLIGGTTTNIARQRYNDSVQDFAEFLRRTYSEVISVENGRVERIDNLSPCTVTSNVSSEHQIAGQSSAGAASTGVQTGRSNCLIYGKLITFGETLNGATDYNTIHVYDVVGSAEYSSDYVLSGDATNDTSSELVRSLIRVNADVLTVRKNSAGACAAVPAGNPSTYQLQWGAYLDNVGTTESRYTGSILIARSPISGAVGTVSFNRALPVQQLLYNNQSVANCYNDSTRAARFSPTSLNAYLSVASGAEKPNVDYNTNICVNSEDRLAPPNGFGGRRMVSVLADGANGSAVKVVNQDIVDPADAIDGVINLCN